MLTLVLQSGGQSSRMGRDKALVPFRGKTLIEHILAQTGGLAQETIVITNRPDEYRFLGLPLYPDVIPDKGALGGLYSAITHARHDLCLVLACDMPFLDRPLLDHLIALASEHDAVVPRLYPAESGGRRELQAEPFRAVYRKTCLAPIRAALDAGKMRVISFFDAVDVRFVDPPEIEGFDPGARSFFNINTPEELAEAEEMMNDER